VTVVKAAKRAAKSDRECLDIHAAQTCRFEMPVLVHEYDDRQHADEGDNCDQNLKYGAVQ
jgi:hypothetical protein